jgi:hypothetical protein
MPLQEVVGCITGALLLEAAGDGHAVGVLIVQLREVLLVPAHEHEQVRRKADQVFLGFEVRVLQPQGLGGLALADQDARALDLRGVVRYRQGRAADQAHVFLQFRRRQLRRARRLLRQHDRRRRLAVAGQSQCYSLLGLSRAERGRRRQSD